LTSKDQKKVFDVIFKNTEDPKEMQVMADFLMGEKDFLSDDFGFSVSAALANSFIK
jgi:hypothetical protein